MINKEFRLNRMDVGITDAIEITEFWWKMKELGLDKKVFYNGNITSAADLFMFWKSCWVYFGYQDDKLVGAIWFNTFTNESCNIHYCSFPGYKSKEAHNEIDCLCKRILEYSQNDAYVIKAVSPYKWATRMFRNLKFNEWVEKDGKYHSERCK